MGIIAKVSAKVQALFGTRAEAVAQEHPVVLRWRKFTTATLAPTIVFGSLAQPDADDERLAQTAALFGVTVTPQAVEQHFTDRTAGPLEAPSRVVSRHVVAAQVELAPVRQRSTAVYLLDSATVCLPDSLGDRFPGCRGSHGGGPAAMKLQVRWDLRRRAFDTLAVEPGRSCDSKTPRPQDELPPGSLRITDLGSFDTEVFQRLDRPGSFWVWRLHFGTSVSSPGGQPLERLAWLSGPPGSFVDQPIRVGAEREVARRVVAGACPRRGPTGDAGSSSPRPAARTAACPARSGCGNTP